ncbi:MAG TPA: DUF1700 domain-containing protein [Firmicutes bacterium]|nr:DUF1700 domain-containing protein [Bacillota bacterium]
MDKEQFLTALERELSRIPQEERENALAYYEEYLTEAGPEREKDVIAELGSVKDIALQLSADYAVKEMEEGMTVSPKKGLRAMWVVILAILASPIALPIGIAIIAVIFALVVSVAAIVLSFWASAIGLTFGGLGGMILGFFAQADSVYSYVAYYGACVGAVGIGILLGLFSFWLTKVTSRGMAHLFRRMVDRRKHEKQVS